MEIFRDKSLSWKSIGLYFYISTTNQDFNRISIEYLVSISKDGFTSVKAGIKELTSNGYLEIIQVRNNGKISHYYYKILK